MRRRAFTLIELLIVIAIIGVLAGLLMPVFSRVKERAKITKTRGLIAELEGALRAYKDDAMEFPYETCSATGFVTPAPLFGISGDPNIPDESFYYQLLNYGTSSPYTKKGKEDVYAPASNYPKRLLLKDPWWRKGPTFSADPNLAGGDDNHLRYFRGPQRSTPGLTAEGPAGTTTLTHYRYWLETFRGNVTTYNLWSLGPNRMDDSSNQSSATLWNASMLAVPSYVPGTSAGAGGDMGADPKAADLSGIQDDITNWNSNTLSK